MEKNMAGPGTESTTPTWEALEDFVRQKAQELIQSILEEDVTELLGRRKSERRVAVDGPVGYRNGYGKPRRLAMSQGTITVRRPRLRGLEARFQSRVLPLFARRTKEVGALLPELYLHALALAGGISPHGNRKDIRLIRGGQVIQRSWLSRTPASWPAGSAPSRRFSRSSLPTTEGGVMDPNRPRAPSRVLEAMAKEEEIGLEDLWRILQWRKRERTCGGPWVTRSRSTGGGVPELSRSCSPRYVWPPPAAGGPRFLRLQRRSRRR